MKDELFNDINVMAYFLWEYTNNGNALKLWCCAEDIAYYFAENNINSYADFYKIVDRDKNDPVYVEFLRSMAYKIFNYTDNNDMKKNWFAAEKFFNNFECVDAAVKAGKIFREAGRNDEILKSVRSENIKEHLKTK